MFRTEHGLRRALLASVVLLGLALVPHLRAQVWNGAGTNDNWGTASNWVGAASPANNGTATVIFGGTTRLTPSVDVNWDVLGLNFSNTAGAFILGGSQLTIRGGGIVNNDGTLQTINNALVLRTAQTWNAASGNLLFGGAVGGSTNLLTINGANNVTLDGVFSGSGGLTKNGTGILTLNGANTASGLLTLSAGTVAVGHNQGTGLGGLTIEGGGLEASGGSRFISNAVSATANFAIGGTQDLTFTGEINLSGDRTITVTNTGTTTFAGKVGQASGSPKLIKAGSGTLALTASNSLTDTITVNAGVLKVGHVNALGSAAQATIINSGGALELNGGLAMGAELLELNGTGISNGGALRSVSGNNSWAGGITLGASTTVNAEAGTLTLSGTIDTANSAYFLTFTGAGDNTSSGLITGSGGVIKEGTGKLTLTGSVANNYTGNTAVNAGTLLLNATALDGSILDTLTIGDDVGGDYADVVRYMRNNQIKSGAGSGITLKTSGWLDLDGYSDTIKIASMEGGKVTTGTGTLTLGAHVAYAATGTKTAHIEGNMGLGANREFTVNNGTATDDLVISAIISGAFSLKKKSPAATGRLVLSGNNTYSGATDIEGGYLKITHDNALGATNSITTVDAGATLEVANNINVGLQALTINGTGVASDGALRNVSGTNSWAGLVTLASSATIASDSGLLKLNGGVDNNAKPLTVDGAGNTTVNGVVSGSGAMIKNGAGTLTLNGTNTYTGDTTINAGIVSISHSNSLGNASAETTINAGTLRATENITTARKFILGSTSSTMEVESNKTFTVNNIVSGTGGLTKTGAGTLYLRGTNTFTNVTTINAGTIAITHARSLGTTNTAATINAGTLRATETFTTWRPFILGASNATVEVDASKVFTVNGLMSGTGGLVKTGNGTLIVGGTNTFTGNLNVNAGTLQLNGNNKFADTVAVGLNGGVFHSGGFNETMGALTLTADSIIDFGNATSVLHFANSSAMTWTPGATLTITNWNGTWFAGGGTDQLYFGSDSTGLTAGQLSQIRFADPNGYYTPAAILANGEVVPVPEPATVIGVALIAGLVVYRERKAIRQLLGRLPQLRS